MFFSYWYGMLRMDVLALKRERRKRYAWICALTSPPDAFNCDYDTQENCMRMRTARQIRQDVAPTYRQRARADGYDLPQSRRRVASTGVGHGKGAARPVRAAHRPRRLRSALIALAVILSLTLALVTQANGPLGAQAADLLRAALGPQLTAQIESWYLNAQDARQRAQYQLAGQTAAAPWPTSAPAPRRPHLIASMPLPTMAPLIQPALAGEGTWSVGGLPVATPGGTPLVAKAFLRPDPARPYAIVTMLQFDLRFDSLHMVAGTQQPGGPLGHAGAGAIPAAAQQGNTLLAAFNGGFKYSDGQYGMMAQGVVYVPPQMGAATIAVTRQGQVLLGIWGSTPGLQANNPNLVAWRQNAALLVDNGKVNPLTHDGAAWGGTILNSSYTWRSGVGITAHDTLIYAAGNSLSAATLGLALQKAGAVYAMQTDINPFWVRAFLYQRDASGALQITKLHPGMSGSGMEYLINDARDFFYITR